MDTANLSAITLEIQVEKAKSLPTFEQLTRSHLRLPVLVYESVKIAQYLRFIKRYKRKLVFAGKMDVVAILLVGFTGYWYLTGTKYASHVVDGLLSILATAKLDDSMYRVTDWYQKKGQLRIHVTKAFGR